MNKTIEFLNGVNVFFISTINGDKPEVRPFGAFNVYNSKLYFITSNEKDVFKQMERNNNIAISAINSEGDWIRISGKAIVDNDINAKKLMLDKYPDLRNLYNENDGKMEVFYLTNAVSIISSFTKQSITERF